MDNEEDLFTADETSLLEAPDEEIFARNQTFSFDVKGCDRRISSGDAWQRIVMAHLYFEHVVDQLLLEAELMAGSDQSQDSKHCTRCDAGCGRSFFRLSAQPPMSGCPYK